MHAPPPERASFGTYLIGGAGLLCVGAIMAVSASLNWSFGFSLGRTPFDAFIYGVASVAADGVKCLAPFFFFAAVKNRLWSNAIAAAAVWLIATAYALVGAFGHAALNRTDAGAKREVSSGIYAALQADRTRIEQELAAIPHFRPAGTVAAEIEAKKTERMFRFTNGCATASIVNASGRAYCADLHKLEAELASASTGASLRQQLADNTTKLGAYAQTGASTQADPQVAELSRLTGIDAGKVKTTLLLAVVALLEIISGLGLYAVKSLFPDRKAARMQTIDSVPVEGGTNVVPFPASEQVESVALDAAPMLENVNAGKESLSTLSPANDLQAEMLADPSDWPAYAGRMQNKDDAENDLHGLVAMSGSIPKQKLLAKRWGVTEGAVTKWLNSWDWISKRREGRNSIVEASYRAAA